MKNMKGQAAMEYLMTYGWALLAIVIVIAALIYLNPFRAPELCLFQQQGFSCSEPNPQVYITGTGSSGDVNMNVRIWNKLGKNVIIKQLVCTTSQASEISAPTTSARGVTIPTGSYKDFSSSATETGQEGIACTDAKGTAVTSSQNQEFRGTMLVWYNYEDDLSPDVMHQAQANVISLVVKAS